MTEANITNAANKQVLGANVALTDTESKLLGKLNEWFTEATSAMQEKRRRWRKNEELYHNKVIVYGKTGWTELKFNLALSIIRTEMSIISDYLPTFDVVGEEKNDWYLASMLQKRKQQVERNCYLNDKILECCEDSLNYGNGLSEVRPVIRTTTLLDGTDVNRLTLNVKTVDPFTWLPAPYATGMDFRTECLYQMFATPVHIDVIKRMYKKTVPAEGYLDDNRAFFKVDDPSNSPRTPHYALVKECYYLDEDMDKYPNGRGVVWANNIILEDKPIGLSMGDKIKREDELCLLPYFLIGNYRSAHTVLGTGDGEIVKSQIKAFNQIMSSLADNIKKQGNPIRKIRKRLYRQLEKSILGVAGEEIEVIDPDDITWDIPPSVPAHTWQFLEWLLKLTDVVTGVHDVTQGRRPVGITAGVAIAELQEAAQTAVRYKIKKYINPYILQMGRYIVYLLQNLDEEIRDIKDYESPELKYMTYDPLGKYDIEGRGEGDKDFDSSTAKSMKDSKLEVEVVTGIKLPAGRFEDESRRMEKFKEGIYGIEEATIYEQNREDIIKGYYERMGLAQLKERQEKLNDAFDKFSELLDTALGTEKEWINSGEEQDMARLLGEFPELLNTEEFKMLPNGYKNNLLDVFKISE